MCIMHPDQVTIVRGAAKAERVYVLLGGEQAPAPAMRPKLGIRGVMFITLPAIDPMNDSSQLSCILD
jgi:hypothetical protein